MHFSETFHRTITWTGILFAILLLTIDNNSTKAQSDCYPRGTIYIVGNMNIRESASTDSRVVSTARTDDSFTASQSQRSDTWCWLNIGVGWIAKTSRVSSTESSNTSRSQKNQVRQPAQQQEQQNVQKQSDIDNCCFVDRQCDTDEEWTSGYWAFQNNQCEAPAGSPTQSQTRGTASEEVNNCCFTGWQCDTNEEWRGGYYAFQQDQCDVSQSHWQAQWRQPRGSSDSHNPNPVSRTYDPVTRTTTFTYEDDVEIIVRPPTREELCNAGLVEFCDDE